VRGCVVVCVCAQSLAGRQRMPAPWQAQCGVRVCCGWWCGDLNMQSSDACLADMCCQRCACLPQRMRMCVGSVSVPAACPWSRARWREIAWVRVWCGAVQQRRAIVRVPNHPPFSACDGAALTKLHHPSLLLHMYVRVHVRAHVCASGRLPTPQPSASVLCVVCCCCCCLMMMRCQVAGWG
jgi:hypothetical protein